jgi:hypothetical protein
MKKLLLAFYLLASVAYTQTFDQEATAAQTALSALQTAAESKVAADNAHISSLIASNASLTTQVTSLKITDVYKDLEWNGWKINCDSQVGGSGNGVGGQVLAPGASFSITPTPPALGQTNYFDCYYTDDFNPDDTKKNFKLTMPWTFPTSADSNASQALEMEIREVTSNHLMGVCALQMYFGGNSLRIFDNVKKWFATGQTQPKLTAGVTYTVTLECHTDGTNMIYDAITINSNRLALGYSYPLPTTNWRLMMRVAGQLDGKGTGTPYKVNRGLTTFSRW